MPKLSNLPAFVWRMRVFAIVGVFGISSFGCENGALETGGKTMSENSKGVDHIVSGYASSPEDWADFLGCWRAELAKRLARKDPAAHGVKQIPADLNLLVRGSGVDDRLIEAVEGRLGVVLPKSYKDYLKVVGGRGWFVESFGNLDEGWEEIGVYAVERIDYYSKLDPVNFAIWRRDSANEWAPDEQYLRYGHATDPEKRQQSTSFRGKYFDGLIKIGGFLQGGAILLNTQLKSSDGEMEVWVLSAKEFLTRYRSFAEMMQVFSYSDIVDGGYLIPPLEEIKSIECVTKLKTVLLDGDRK